MTENIIPHNHTIDQTDRINKLGYKPLLIWFVGMSGSGKSTLASALEEKLFADGLNTYILDGDNIRSGLNKDLDFTDDSRKENIRRIAEVSKLFVDAGTVVLTAFITPFAEERAKVRQLVGSDNYLEVFVDCPLEECEKREKVRQLVGSDNYLEVFVDCPLEECEKRDVKGLYAKARRGEIKNFTGIDSPFEKPSSPDVLVESHKVSIADGVDAIYKIVKEKININE